MQPKKEDNSGSGRAAGAYLRKPVPAGRRARTTPGGASYGSRSGRAGGLFGRANAPLAIRTVLLNYPGALRRVDLVNKVADVLVHEGRLFVQHPMSSIRNAFDGQIRDVLFQPG